jgi:hypothetical protein
MIVKNGFIQMFYNGFVYGFVVEKSARFFRRSTTFCKNKEFSVWKIPPQ